MDYDVSDNIKVQGVSDLLDLITSSKGIEPIVAYDYVIKDVDGEVVETGDLMELIDDEETELEYHQDETYQLFVQKAMDTSVKFQTLYQEQRIFNIILLSGVSLICLIVMFGMISLA